MSPVFANCFRIVVSATQVEVDFVHAPLEVADIEGRLADGSAALVSRVHLPTTVLVNILLALLRLLAQQRATQLLEAIRGEVDRAVEISRHPDVDRTAPFRPKIVRGDVDPPVDPPVEGT